MFSPLVERALAVTLDAHGGQRRKGSATPYSVHPLHVALIVAQWGADEETVAAALLHDVVEDCPEWTLAELDERFGPAVARTVAELTEDKARTWEERKEHAIASIPGLSERACVVKAADKLHNLSSLADALAAANGDAGAVWARFCGGRERTIAKDRRLIEALAARVPERVARDLWSALEAVERLG
jgi:(p)ppGpp synthase/HD superfamily hydrolase